MSCGNVGDESQHDVKAAETDVFAIYVGLVEGIAVICERVFTFSGRNLNAQTTFEFYLSSRNQ